MGSSTPLSDIRFERLQKGQFETPAMLCDLMLAAVIQKPSDRILDPATGEGIFLARALAQGHRPGCLFGVEADPAIRPQLPPGVTLHQGSFLGDLPEAFQNFDVVIGNPPYIRHEMLSSPMKSEIQTLCKTQAALSEIPHSLDAALWFIIRSWALLKPGGRLCMVMGSGWLQAKSSRAFWPWLLQHYRIEKLIESDVERWFEEAATHACVLILEKRDLADMPPENERFERIRLQRPLGEITSFEKLSSDAAQIQAVSSRALMTPSDWRPLPDVLVSLMDSGNWLQLGDLGEVRYPIKTGINRFFYVDGQTAGRFGIEPEFLIPAVKSMRHIRTYRITEADCPLFLFCCGENPDTLKQRGKTGALAYIAWGEAQEAPPRQKRQSATPWPVVASVRSRVHWYQLEAIATAHLLCSRFFDRRIFFAECGGRMIEDQTFYGLTLNNPVDLGFIAALLNSTLGALLVETHGRNTLGEGVLQFSRSDMAGLPLPDPSLYSAPLRREISGLWLHLRKQAILPVAEVILQPDRMALDERVLSPWKKPALRQLLVDALLQRIETRLRRSRTVHRQ